MISPLYIFLDMVIRLSLMAFILQHIGGTMVKMEAATIVNHNVLIVAEQTALSVYRCELLLQRTGVTL